MPLNLFDCEFDLENLGISEDIHALVVVFKGFHIVFLDLVELVG